jgi:CPA1 family monovalent cation:H+ antiporter
LSAVGEFAFVFGGGVLVGLSVAWGARQLQRVTQDSISQIVLTMTAVYGSYGLASALGVSGLIAVAVTGLLYGNTVLFHIQNKDVERETRDFWNVLAFIANTVAFLFIGISTNIFSLAGNLGVILTAYAVVVMSRIASVYPILILPGIMEPGVPWSWRNVAMLGGTRGALSIALVASLPSSLPGYSTLVNMTFGVAVISILVQGPLLSAYVGRAFGRQQTLSEASAQSTTPTPPENTEQT